jgi:acetoin utilization protein AcuC
VLNGIEIPARLPPAAEAVLRGLVWTGARAGKTPPAHWFTTLRDAPREGPVREEVRARLRALGHRARVWA